MRRLPLCLVCLIAAGGSVRAQEYGRPDRGEPGDRMIQEHLDRVARTLQKPFADDVTSLARWQSQLPRYREEYLYMLGLWPLPAKSPLQATITGAFEGDGYVVDLLHYQSTPGLYVTANLYRPAAAKAGERLPAVLYVCGHSPRGRDGNKAAFQPHGIWFARHGYVCLVVDTLQLGEIAAIHHGTYRENRWWWHSRGYTPAGVECWNGVRGIDYLVSRPDVDPERIAVTGISGGGAATFWVAGADERVKVAVPVSGMADLESYVGNRVVNGHCDCMFLYNTFEWPWVRIAGLVAPRPMLFINSDKDSIFPMDANERVINQLERLYSRYELGDRVDSVVSVGGHAYRKEIRQAAFRFINTYLKGDPRPIVDSEVDLSDETVQTSTSPIEGRLLRVFRTDGDIPLDELNTKIDQSFVPMASVAVPSAAGFADWKKALQAELGRVVFRSLPERIPAAKVAEREAADSIRLETEPGISVRLHLWKRPAGGANPKGILLVVQNPSPGELPPDAADSFGQPDDAVYRCEPRGTGATRWTVTNPPNYVLRSHVLLGRTVDTGRLFDVIAAARYLIETNPGVPVYVAGAGPGAVIAGYAALREPDVAGAVVDQPPATHIDPGAPQFLNVLRVGDIPDLLGAIAPRPLTLVSGDAKFAKTAAYYAAAGATDKLARPAPPAKR